MKKYLLVSLTLLFAAAFLWADEVTNAEQKAAFEGNATLSWGIDLGSGKRDFSDRAKHGFRNAASWKVTFPLLKKGDAPSKTPEGAQVYAEVQIKDIELGFESKQDAKDFKVTGKVDGISGKLVFYGAYLTVYDKPSFKTNYADLWKPFKNDDFKNDKDNGFKFEPGFDGAGTKIGYANKNMMDLDVGLKFGSNGDWDAKDGKLVTTEYFFEDKILTGPASYIVPAGQIWYGKGDGTTKSKYRKKYEAGTTIAVDAGKMVVVSVYKVETEIKDKERHSKYGFGFDFSMKPLDKLFGFKFSINSTFGAAKTNDKSGKLIQGYDKGVVGHIEDQVALSFGTELKSEPIDALKFTFGFDLGYAFDVSAKKSVAWDMLFNTEYKWVSGGLYVSSVGTPYAGFNGKTKKSTADMAVYLKFETKGDKKEASNLVEGLDAGIYLGMFRLLSKAPDGAKTQLPMLMKLWGSYKAQIGDSMWIKPVASFWLETNHYQNESGKVVKIPYIGVAYDLGVTYSPIEKVEITAKWAHGKLANNVYAQNVNVNRDGDTAVIKKPAWKFDGGCS